MSTSGRAPHVVVVGGGLAGLSASVALAEAGCRVELFEARRYLGGRATSFRDPASDELVDHCQHVSMRCCTNLADFCRRTGTAELFRRDRMLYFVGPSGDIDSVCGANWLPAPLHLAPSFLRVRYLKLGDKLRIGQALWKLMRRSPASDDALTIGAWLKQNKQSRSAIECFWSPILVSALGEELDRASLNAARQVLVDGFLGAREAYQMEVPRVPLGEIYGERMLKWFASRNVEVHLNSPIRKVAWRDRPIIATGDDCEIRPDYAILALPWSKAPDLVSSEIAARCPGIDGLRRLKSSPITGVHLWFDREVLSMRHAVLLERTSQWIFNRSHKGSPSKEHYYQVLISASRGLAGRDRDAIVQDVCSELAAIWPWIVDAKLVRSRVVTEHNGVLSLRPGVEALRPNQETALPGLLLAGDWTKTGWPSTMEGAVRSGYLAAESILRSSGRAEPILRPDLPRGRLARWLIRN